MLANSARKVGDFIYPAHGHEYVLKGPESSPSPQTLESLMKAEGRVTNSSIHGEGEISEVTSNG